VETSWRLGMRELLFHSFFVLVIVGVGKWEIPAAEMELSWTLDLGLHKNSS
jgi:hypothetical protein